VRSETIIVDNPDAEIRRLKHDKPRLSLLNNIYVERGNLEDWKLLHELHYKASNLGIGPRFWRCAIDDETIGVICITVPKPLDSGRNQVFPHLRANTGGRDSTLVNKARMAWLNKNLVLCSRQILDTMYRGAGIAYRFRNLTFRMSGYRYVEARSAMSRFNPFYQKTGMKILKPKTASCHEAGLAFFARNFTAPAYDQVALIEELNAMPEYLRESVLKELRAFYYRHSSMEKSGDNRLRGTERVDGMNITYLLKQTQQLVFGSTIYAVYENPDHGRELPSRLPVIAFDNQKTNEPLRLDLL
jgi:uncharacterized protein